MNQTTVSETPVSTFDPVETPSDRTERGRTYSVLKSFSVVPGLLSGFILGVILLSTEKLKGESETKPENL